MKLSRPQIEQLVRRVFTELQGSGVATLKAPIEKILARGVELIEAEYRKERELEREVHRVLDDLEKQESEGFDRHKMFLMLKRRMAQERKLVL